MNEPSPPSVSIIVPTYREVGNLRALTERLFTALQEASIEGELILVDDNSDDGSEEVVNELAKNLRRQSVPGATGGLPASVAMTPCSQSGQDPKAQTLRIIVRKGERGLSSAVLRGFEEARADLLVVMDADLQHPPEAVPELVRRLCEGDCDFVLGTRYGGGAIAQNWPWIRRLSSRFATALARPLAPLSDPMSGFFALRRETWSCAADRLNPLGYKIGLELFVKGGCTRPVEVPIEFALRAAGESKFSFREQWLYARHLIRLYRFRFPVAFWVGCIALVAVVVLAVGWVLRPV